MTTAVYFDLDGTLLTYDAAFEDLFARTLPDAGADAFETYADTVLAALREQAPDPYERAFAAVRERHDVDTDADPTALAAAYVEHEVAATRVPDPARRLLERLAREHPTGILTNGHGPTQRRKVTAHDLDAVVDSVLVSSEVGARKPDGAIFRAARDALPADRHVHVGDTYDEDVVGARDAGFLPVYVGDEHRGRAETGVSADGIAALAETLLALLA